MKHNLYYLTSIAIRTSTIMGLMLLSACSDTEQSNQATTTSPTTTKSSTTQTEPAKSVNFDLLSTPLDKQAYLGLIVPEIEEAAPCPFLTDKTALATVKTDWILKRRETSNESCYWSKNSGFSVKVTVEPLATAKPVQQRSYNLASPPVIKNQTEPGNNAVVLYDTAWDKEQAYAMAFEQDNKLVMIYVTGMTTDAERLITTAKEVAAELPTAPTLSSSAENNGPFDVCSTWSQSSIEAILGTPVNVTPGNLDCKWENGEDESLKQVRVTIYSGKSYPWESLLEQRASDIPGIGERGLMERKRKKNSMPAHVLLNILYDEMLVTVTTTDTIADHEAVALALAKNIDSRLK